MVKATPHLFHPVFDSALDGYPTTTTKKHLLGLFEVDGIFRIITFIGPIFFDLFVKTVFKLFKTYFTPPFQAINGRLRYGTIK